MAITRMLRTAGVRKMAIVDRKGVIHPSRGDLTEVKQWLGEQTVRLGQARPGLRRTPAPTCSSVCPAAPSPRRPIASMAPDSIVFALANPHPEVHPDVAGRHARIVATGRSDFPNQINNVLVFPGIFRGALDVRATGISEA